MAKKIDPLDSLKEKLLIAKGQNEKRVVANLQKMIKAIEKRRNTKK